ncbi:MAG: LytR/AlgR family response regulator transcription factor, partial [bacterium]
FTTGYPDYAAAAYDLDAVDYLLKPLTAGRVTEAVRRVRSRLERVDTAQSSTSPPLRIFIPAGDHHKALAPEAIRFVEARRGHCVLHADDGSHPVHAPLARLERALAGHGFLRTHRAYLVNLSRVRALVTWSRHAHSLLLDAGKETHVPVAKSRLAAFRHHVVWIPGAGGPRDGPGPEGQGGDRRRRKPGTGPGDR